ncbi:MAG: anti-sigma-factor antagonist [Acidimicrobiales bacterium]|nr:anti-sigma-factor antagonist [Acidimicrobiales bacterium]
MVSSSSRPAGSALHSGPAPVVSRDGESVVVWLAGEQDLSTRYVLADTLAREIFANESDMIIDLSGVTFIDASAIGVLIGARNVMIRRSRRVVLRAPSTAAVTILKACGLDDLLPHQAGGPRP